MFIITLKIQVSANIFYFVIYLFQVSFTYTPETSKKRDLRNLIEWLKNNTKSEQWSSLSWDIVNSLGLDTLVNDTNSVWITFPYCHLKSFDFLINFFLIFLHHWYSNIHWIFKLSSPRLILSRWTLSSIPHSNINSHILNLLILICISS